MSAEAIPAPGGGGLLTRIKWMLADGWTVTRFNLIGAIRVPEMLVFLVIQPVLFVVLFVYVFGGAIGGSLPPGIEYAEFLLPGIIVQTITFNGITTGIGLAEDLGKGVIDRMRSLPMARSAVLVGRTSADLVRNVLATVLMLAIGFVVGFSFVDASVLDVLAGFGLILAFGFAFSWIAALIGLAVPSAEVAQSAGFIWLFPLTFASSAFVPVDSMPGILKTFAEINPVTVTVDALRDLWIGIPAPDAWWQSLLWSVALIAIFAPLATAKYRRTTSK